MPMWNGFAALVLSLSNLTRGAEEWRWTAIEEVTFNSIKTKLLAAPVLRLPDIDLPFQVTTDASKWCIGGVLSQVIKGFDHPVSFYSKKLSSMESKWPSQEQELYASRSVLGGWSCYLIGDKFFVYTDNTASRWFQHHPNMSPRMTRWLTFFGQFCFELKFKTGVSNVVADALSSPPVFSTTAGSFVFTARFPTRYAKVLIEVASCFDPFSMPKHVAIASSTFLTVGEDDEFIQLIQSSYNNDRDCVEVLQALRQSNQSVMARYEVKDGLLRVLSKDAVPVIRIPQVEAVLLRVLHDFHDSAVVFHPGIQRTFSAIRQYFFWWPIMREHIDQYVGT
ncbi:hypothetical protein PsorP6_011848 [Peronosclerospora sorghi]|uniref:Uncharacterized protein n=1 Tax=Peronosclerospora sorghi TaxID=230839 RepID=A0ACC0WID5_9STRA|nr:hypothetical protein PsorP6_011848 [Peronosclerospora sorghi]